MTWYVGMVMYWGGSLLMFFEPFGKCSCWFTNVPLITLHPITSISICDSTFFRIWSLSFGAMMTSVPSTKKCKYPTWALNRVQMRSQNPNYNKRSNNNNNKQNKSSIKNLYMVVPYYQSLSKSIKRSCKKYGIQVHFKGGLTIRKLLMAPKDKYHILKKVESHIDIDVIGRSVMRGTLVNQQEHLPKGSKNIKRLPPQYMTIPTYQVMMSTLTTLA